MILYGIVWLKVWFGMVVKCDLVWCFIALFKGTVVVECVRPASNILGLQKPLTAHLHLTAPPLQPGLPSSPRSCPNNTDSLHCVASNKGAGLFQRAGQTMKQAGAKGTSRYLIGIKS